MPRSPGNDATVVSTFINARPDGIRVVFPDTGAVLPYFWVPGTDLDERENHDRGVPYRLWRDQKLIEAPAGKAVDKRAVARRIAEIVAPYDLAAVAFDRWRIEDFKKTWTRKGSCCR